jgi:hypothetical protein
MTMPPDVRAAFDAVPVPARTGMLALRRLILDVAADTPEAGPVTEVLRWGQPAYLAPKGSTVRVGVPKGACFALFVHCRTSLIPEFRLGPGTGLRYEGTRAVLFDDVRELAAAPLRPLIRRALLYHSRFRVGESFEM